MTLPLQCQTKFSLINQYSGLCIYHDTHGHTHKYIYINVICIFFVLIVSTRSWQDTAKMMYCPPNITFDHIWVNHGISHCFLDTVTSAVYALFITIFGGGQWLMYRKYATMTDQYLRPKSVLFGIQVTLTVLMVFIATARLILQATIIGKSSYGTLERNYMSVNFVFLYISSYIFLPFFYSKDFFLLCCLSSYSYQQSLKENDKVRIHDVGMVIDIDLAFIR